MALEDLTGAGKGLNNLVPANPDGLDARSEGDNHIRGLKNVLLNVFGPMQASSVALPNRGSVLAWDGDVGAYKPIGASKDADLFLQSIYGSFKFSLLSSEPGWIRCTGQDLVSPTYANLRAWIVANPNSYVNIAAWPTRPALFAFAGDNTATGTIRCPMLAGYFIRCVNNENPGNPDAARLIGDIQAHSFQSHGHGITDPGHLHFMDGGASLYSNQAGGTFLNGTSGGIKLVDKTGFSGTGITVGNPNSGSSGSETRPYNIALYPLVFIGRA